MIQQLQICNLALVTQSTLDLEKGFNVLTGETGSGKSILMNALGLIAGQKASMEDVRQGEASAYVEGVVLLPSQSKAFDFLTQVGIVFDSSEVLLKRVVHSDGKSKAYINGQQSTVTNMLLFSRFWLDMTGQHVQHQLLDVKSHLNQLDSFAQLDFERKKMEESFLRTKAIHAELKNIQEKKIKIQADRDYWEFQKKELDDLNIRSGELEELEQQFQRQKHSQNLLTTISNAREILDEESGLLSNVTK